MPRERILLSYTNAFKLKLVLDYIAAAKDDMTRKTFCTLRDVKRSTLQTWQRKLKKLIAVSERRGTAHPSRANRLTLGGSGRASPSAPVEDAVVTFIEDARREEQVVTRDMIIAKTAELAPAFMDNKSVDAQLQWCARFMRRNGLTIRRITHSGRKTRSDLEEARLSFVVEVLKVTQEHCFDPRLGLAPKRTIFNVDQTSIYSTMGSRTTVEVVGATRVPTLTEGSDSYRCTMAVTVAADGRKFPPHFVFRGQPGGDVEREVRSYCEEEVATFSVQAKAWFDLRVMLDWIENAWKPIVTEPSLLILDSLKVHKMAEVLDALAYTGTAVQFVPGDCTGVAQPLDVGVMAPLKQHIRKCYSNRQVGRPRKITPGERRYGMYCRAISSLERITEDTVRNAFHKAGSFVQYGPQLHG